MSFKELIQLTQQEINLPEDAKSSSPPPQKIRVVDSNHSAASYSTTSLPLSEKEYKSLPIKLRSIRQEDNEFLDAIFSSPKYSGFKSQISTIRLANLQ